MGGAASRSKDVEGELDVVGKEQYAWWTFGCVQRAVVRARGVFEENARDPGTRPAVATFLARGVGVAVNGRLVPVQLADSRGCTLITRQQFFTIFTDLHQIKDGGFLALSLDIFDAFVLNGHLPLEHPAGGTPFADAMQVLLVVTLFCQGGLEKQLRACFHLFDADDNHAMDPHEVAVFFSALAEACYHVRLIPVRVTGGKLRRLAGGLFEGGETHVSRDDFVAWAKTHVVTKELLGRLDETKKKAQRTVDPRRVQSMQGVAVEDGRRNLRDVRIQSRMEAKRLLTEITSQTDFELEELSDLRAMFQGAVGKTGELTRQQFQDVMAHHRSFRATPAAVLGALFDSFDGDNSGLIDFKEFTIGMSKLVRGTTSEKLELLFETLSGGKDEIDLIDLIKFIRSTTNELQEDAEFATEILNKMDANGDGVISMTEFQASLDVYPIILNCFAGCALPGLEPIRKPLRSCIDKPSSYLVDDSRWSIDYLHELWVSITHDDPRESAARVTKPEFRLWFQDTFEIPLETVPFVDALFDLVAERKRDVRWRDCFYGMVQLIGGEPKQRATMCFHLFDEDGSGDLDKDELVTLVNAGQLASNVASVDATRMLHAMDTDRSGTVSWDEFFKAALEDPGLRECFRRLFGVSEQDDTERARRSRLGPLQRTLSKQLIAPNKPLRLVAKKSGRRTSFSSDGVDPTKRSASNHLATTRLVRAVQQKRDALASLRKQSIGTISTVTWHLLKLTEKLKEKRADDAEGRRDSVVFRNEVHNSVKALTVEEGNASSAAAVIAGARLQDVINMEKQELRKAVRHVESEALEQARRRDELRREPRGRRPVGIDGSVLGTSSATTVPEPGGGSVVVADDTGHPARPRTGTSGDASPELRGQTAGAKLLEFTKRGSCRGAELAMHLRTANPRRAHSPPLRSASAMTLTDSPRRPSPRRMTAACVDSKPQLVIPASLVTHSIADSEARGPRRHHTAPAGPRTGWALDPSNPFVDVLTGDQGSAHTGMWASSSPVRQPQGGYTTSYILGKRLTADQLVARSIPAPGETAALQAAMSTRHCHSQPRLHSSRASRRRPRSQGGRRGTARTGRVGGGATRGQFLYKPYHGANRTAQLPVRARTPLPTAASTWGVHSTSDDVQAHTPIETKPRRAASAKGRRRRPGSRTRAHEKAYLDPTVRTKGYHAAFGRPAPFASALVVKRM